MNRLRLTQKVPGLLATSLALGGRLLFAVETKADVEAVNIVLAGEDNEYTVPDGKVLIIEHFIWALESGFYAQSVAIEPSAQGDNFLAIVELDSPLPARVSVEASADFEQWQEVAESKVTATGDPSIYDVEVDQGQTDQKFLRARAEARPRNN